MKNLVYICLVMGMSHLTALAGLVFDNKEITVKAGIDDKQAVAIYSFENKGTEPVVISKVHSVCPYCLAAQAAGGTRLGTGENMKFLYKPGEKGKIRAAFTLGTFTGTVKKDIKIYQEGDTEPSIKLVCKIVIPDFIKLSSKSLSWSAEERGMQKKLTIEVVAPKPITLFAPSCSSDEFQLEFKELKKGRKYELLVTPKKGAKPSIAICFFKTDSTHVKYRRVRYYLKLK